jgi:hypothetical protein
MRVGKSSAGSKLHKEWEALSSPLDEILKRLEAIERRLAQLETDAPARRPDSEASNAADFGRLPTNPVAPTAQATAAPAPAVPVPSRSATPQPVGQPSASEPATRPEPSRAKVAVGDEPKSYSPTATAPATERLHPLSKERGSSDDPFPDLSMLDEKVEPRKGPAQRLEVKAAIEDYQRICARIQQLWGTPECESYITNLVIDTRGNRKGFPPAVMEELLYLGRLARALVILGIDGDLWDTFDQVGDRR